MKLFLECGHEIDEANTSEIFFKDGEQYAFCKISGEEQKIIKFGNSDADQRTHTARMAQ